MSTPSEPLDHVQVLLKTGVNQEFSTADIKKRFGHHRESDTSKAVRNHFIEIALYLDKLLPPGREKNLAFNNLQISLVWAMMAIAENTSAI